VPVSAASNHAGGGALTREVSGSNWGMMLSMLTTPALCFVPTTLASPTMQEVWGGTVDILADVAGYYAP